MESSFGTSTLKEIRELACNLLFLCQNHMLDALFQHHGGLLVMHSGMCTSIAFILHRLSRISCYEGSISEGFLRHSTSSMPLIVLALQQRKAMWVSSRILKLHTRSSFGVLSTTTEGLVHAFHPQCVGAKAAQPVHAQRLSSRIPPWGDFVIRNCRCSP